MQCLKGWTSRFFAGCIRKETPTKSQGIGLLWLVCFDSNDFFLTKMFERDISSRRKRVPKTTPPKSRGWDLPPILVHLLPREAKGSGFWSRGSGRRQQEQVVPQNWSGWKRSPALEMYKTPELWDKKSPSLSSAKLSRMIIFWPQYHCDTMLVPCLSCLSWSYTFSKQKNHHWSSQHKKKEHHPLTLLTP